MTAIVSDGHSTEEALRFVAPVTDVFRVDLKAATAEAYRSLGGRREPVLASIALARELGLWVEVVTLVVPGLSDDLAGLDRIARELAAIDRDLPWHVDAMVPRYRMLRRPRPPVGLLIAAAAAGYGAGLRYVYVGNVANEMPHLQHTRCPECHDELVRRSDWATVEQRHDRGRCRSCGASVSGRFGA
jgi:pyruvate formate lyase activating enzyme